MAPGSGAERRVIRVAFICGAALLAADQISKLWVMRFFRVGEARPLIPGYLSFTSVRNYGAAWSILSGQGWLLLLVAAVVTVLVLVFFRRLTEGMPERYIALGIVLSGVVGNSIDRLWHGAVVDFIDVHYYRVWHYPVFNIADIAICTGVGLFILSNLLRKPSVPEKKTASGGGKTS